MRWIAAVLALLLIAVATVRLVGPGLAERDMNRVLPHEPWPVTEAAASLHRRLRIADWHSDTLLWARDPLERADRGHVDVPRLEDGNVAVQVFTAVTKSPAGQNYEENATDARDNITLLAVGQGWPPRTWSSLAERALYQAERLQRAADEAPERLRLVTDAEAFDEALRQRDLQGAPVIALLGTEGLHALDGDLANLDRLWDAGYRVFGLQHFFDNALGGSLHGQSGEGLTPFGREVVQEIVRRGGIIDVAHSAPAVVRDVLALTDRPPIVSHTGLSGACDTPRNFTDWMMGEIADRGGLLGIGFWDAAVCDVSPEGIARSIAYGVERFGAEHISLGSDYDGSTEVPFDASELSALTQALVDEGLTDAQIAAVMGENTLAFLKRWLPAPSDAT